MKKTILWSFLGLMACMLTFTACSNDDDVEATGISLTKKNITLEKGSSDSLKVVISPNETTNKEVKWSTSDANIVKVDNEGKITALKTGTAIITVSLVNSNLTAQCEVTVISTVSSITLNKANLSITEGKKDTLTATILPSDATNKKVTWKSDDASIVEISSNGEIAAIKPGTATVTCTTTDQNKNAQCTITVTSSKNINYNPYGDTQNW